MRSVPRTPITPPSKYHLMACFSDVVSAWKSTIITLPSSLQLVQNGVNGTERTVQRCQEHPAHQVDHGHTAHVDLSSSEGLEVVGRPDQGQVFVHQGNDLFSSQMWLLEVSTFIPLSKSSAAVSPAIP